MTPPTKTHDHERDFALIGLGGAAAALAAAAIAAGALLGWAVWVL